MRTVCVLYVYGVDNNCSIAYNIKSCIRISLQASQATRQMISNECHKCERQVN